MVRSQESRGAGASTRPLFARFPLLGFALAAAGGVFFGILALNVRRKGRLLQWDEPVCQALHVRAMRDSRSEFAVVQIGATMGREAALALTLLLGAFWVLKRRWRQLALLLVGVIGGNTWFLILSRFFKRKRPTFSNPFHTIAGPGFPSGHSMTAVTLYGLIFYLLLPRLRSWPARCLVALPTGAMVLLVGFTRLYLGDHYPTDVLGGYGFGLFWGALVTTLIDRIGS